MSTNVAIWWLVPNGSTIKLWVVDGGSDILARATLTRTDDVPCPPLGHDDLVVGPPKIVGTLNNNASYEINPEVVFQGKENQTATIHAQVFGPTNQVIPDSNGELAYAYTVQGKAKDKPARAKLNVINKDA